MNRDFCMHKHIFRLFLLLLPLMGLESCTNDLIDGGMSSYGTLPVEFMFEEPEEGFGPATRGTETYKEQFEQGDVIHVQGIFESKEGEIVTEYGAMRLNASRKWEPVEGSTLYWPMEAVSGTFKAYYVVNSNYMLANHTGTDPIMLSDVKDGEDPLEAASRTVPYGNAVNMRFTHACTYLTLDKLEANVSDYYWLVFPGSEDIKNAYQLTREGGELELKFISIPDSRENNLVYISSRAMPQIIDGQSYSMASFYLAPDSPDPGVPSMYNYFDLRTNSNFPFMSFLNSLTEPLLANRPYVLNVENAKGANVVTNTQIDWDEETAGWKIDVPEFLKSIANGKEYYETDENGNPVQITLISNGRLLLQHNLDFDFYEDYDYTKWGFYPDVDNATIFDGNLHYIENIGHPVFRFNYGTIQNLGLRTLRSDVTLYEGSSEDNYANDFSRVGGLVNWNRSSGVINNIRIEDFVLNVKIHAENPVTSGTNSNENYNIGGVCGENWNTLSEVALKGDIVINVSAEQTTGEYSYVDANANIGGIVGNHTSTLQNVGPETNENYRIFISNTCRGRSEWGSGVFCVGGAVGLSTGNQISQVMIQNVTIDGTDSDGYQQYTGGLSGRLRGNSCYVSDCTVQGSLTCGTVSSYGQTSTNPYSYMGGISGNVRGYTVSNCRAICNVTANMANAGAGICATGGAFGRLMVDCNIIGCSAYGNQLTGPQREAAPVAYVGTFAGIANEAYTWSSLSGAGNTVRAFTGLQEIGAYINDVSGD